jgi:SAM-dependent methyltransferase
MSVQFDYSPYSVTYASRPDYVPDVVQAVLRTSDVSTGDPVCDVGAGSGHLTEPLLEHGLVVDAVEPNAAMRAVGMRRIPQHSGVTWHTGIGEKTGMPADRYALVAFGSSFDRTDRPAALRETARILRPGGYFACLWNHRLLDDPLQTRIEEVIKDHVPDYSYGVRRTDQRPVIEECGLFTSPVHLCGRKVFRVQARPWCEAWRSHLTLGEQAGARFETVLDAIRALVEKEAGDWIDVPYETRAWVARCTAEAGRE